MLRTCARMETLTSWGYYKPAKDPTRNPPLESATNAYLSHPSAPLLLCFPPLPITSFDTYLKIIVSCLSRVASCSDILPVPNALLTSTHPVSMGRCYTIWSSISLRFVCPTLYVSDTQYLARFVPYSHRSHRAGYRHLPKTPMKVFSLLEENPLSVRMAALRDLRLQVITTATALRAARNQRNQRFMPSTETLLMLGECEHTTTSFIVNISSRVVFHAQFHTHLSQPRRRPWISPADPNGQHLRQVSN